MNLTENIRLNYTFLKFITRITDHEIFCVKLYKHLKLKKYLFVVLDSGKMEEFYFLETTQRMPEEMREIYNKYEEKAGKNKLISKDLIFYIRKNGEKANKKSRLRHDSQAAIT